MTMEAITSFFMWCTIINAGLLIISSIIIMLMSEWAYNIHSKIFDIPRDTFNVAIYSFLGIYKIAIILFNLVPWIALLIIG